MMRNAYSFYLLYKHVDRASALDHFTFGGVRQFSLGRSRKYLEKFYCMRFFFMFEIRSSQKNSRAKTKTAVFTPVSGLKIRPFWGFQRLFLESNDYFILPMTSGQVGKGKSRIKSTIFSLKTLKISHFYAFLGRFFNL